MEKYYGRVEKKIETCQKYANILTALSDEDMLIAGDISGNMETEEEAIAQYLTEMEKLTKDISEQSLTDSFMTYSSVNKELMEQLKECRKNSYLVTVFLQNIHQAIHTFRNGKIFCNLLHHGLIQSFQ